MQTIELVAEQVVVTRPFHETIVDVIFRCHPHPAESQIWLLLELVGQTKIPENHDKIIEMICWYFATNTGNGWKEDGRIKETIASLLAQKQQAKQ